MFYLCSVKRIKNMNRQKIENKIRPYAYAAAFWSTVLASTFAYLSIKANAIESSKNSNISTKTHIVDVYIQDSDAFHIEENYSLKGKNKHIWHKPTSHKKIKVSNAGKRMIKKFETLQLTSYRIEGENSNTIGWGHKINSDDPIWLRRKWVGEKITKEQADEIFRNDIEKFVEPALNRMADELLENDINPNYVRQSVWDGLASLIFNCGEQGVKTTEFYQYFKVGKFDKAISLVDGTKVFLNGHKVRRKEEQKMMNRV